MPALPSIPIVSVVGSRRSGKTTAVEALVRGLTAKGYRVTTVKHIHQPDFTIDTEARDTWRHAHAGAKIVVAVAAGELTTIKKVDTTKYTLSDITKNCEDNTDVIIVEGFRNLVAQDLTIPKVVTARTTEEIEEALRVFKPIVAFTGLVSKTEGAQLKIPTPLVDVIQEPRRLIEIVEKRIGPIIQKRRGSKETVIIDINGKMLPLNSYVQKVTRNVLFGIISTLKGATVNGDENVQITIRSPS